MHRSQRSRHGTGAIAGATNDPSASPESRGGTSPCVLLITRDRNLTDRLAQLLSDFTGDSLTIQAVERISDATQRLKQSDAVDAVLFDWDLPTTPGFETLLVLMGKAPQ